MSEKIIIYHNPRCSKSRQTLKLIREKGQEPEITDYLKNPPSAGRLREIVKMLGITAFELLRTKDKEYTELGLSDTSLEKEIIEAISKYPKLMERPGVIKGHKAVLGRPPENVNKLL
jgi:arsenate reductase (glutaredoxin)